VTLLSINNTQLYFERIGHGPTLLFIHGGFGMDASYFRPYLDPLSQNFDCFFLDVRGNGRSAALTKEQITITHILDDLEALRKQLGIEKWTVIGHSGGGLLAESYGLAHPATTHRVILLGSFGRIPFKALEWIAAPKKFNQPSAMKAFSQFWKGISTDADYCAACMAIAPLFFANPAKADLTPLSKIQYRIVPFNAMFDNHGTVDLIPKLAALQPPLLAIHGRCDWRVPFLEAELVATTVPHGRFLLLEDAGHFPFFEKPNECMDAIRDFVEES
jgi:proline iminopeptidase